MTNHDLDVLRVLVDLDNPVTQRELAYQLARRGHVLDDQALHASLTRLLAAGHIDMLPRLGEPSWSAVRVRASA